MQLINRSDTPAVDWRDALVSGNGTMGIMVYGDPFSERVILNHELLYEFIGTESIEPVEIASVMPFAKQLFKEGRFREGTDLINEHAKRMGHPGILWTDPYHPACALTISRIGREYKRSEYSRSLIYETGEIRVEWREEKKLFRRCSFVSRSENVIAMKIETDSKDLSSLKIGLVHQIDLEELRKKGANSNYESNIASLFPDTLSSLNLPLLVDKPYSSAMVKKNCALLRFHVDYQLADRSYDVLALIRFKKGRAEVYGDEIILNANSEVEILARILPWEDHEDKNLDEFFKEMNELDSYDRLLDRHIPFHKERFERVKLELDKTGWKDGSNEELITLQKNSNKINPYLLEKIFQFGLFGLISSSGENPPNLMGIWNGEWRPTWSGDFTTDANLNLQISPAAMAGLHEPIDSYMKLLERIAPDWEINARKLFGCRGYLAGTRTSGRRNLHTHFLPWPGHFWTAGAGWLLQPCYEYWLCSGDREFLINRLLPMMEKTALFYEDFLDIFDDDGNVLIAPSYSPENIPRNMGEYEGAVANATMDIAVIHELLSNLISIYEEFNMDNKKIESWKKILKCLPPYLINNDGALKEWAHSDFEDNYDHRHLSHLYPVWPGLEINAEETPELYSAAKCAAEMRGRGNGSAHGLMHMALVQARLKSADSVYNNILFLLKNNYLYSSLFTSHNPGRIYNSDALHSLPAVVMEMLIYSCPGVIELVPALSERLPKGRIFGVRCRTQAIIKKMEWDFSERKVHAIIQSFRSQEIKLRLRRHNLKAWIDRSEVNLNGKNSMHYTFNEGESIAISFYWSK